MTEHRFDAAEVGVQLGTEGVGNLITKVEEYCACEEHKIALTNEPQIIALSAEASWLIEEEQEILDRLRLAPPAGDIRTRYRKAVYYGIVAAVLTVAGFVFSLYALEPFRIGLKAYLYCLGIAIVEPFLVDYVLDPWKGRVVIKSCAAFACAAGLLSLVLLADIRGDRLAEETKSANPVVIIDDAQPQPAQGEDNFYEKTTPLLQLVMILLSIAMELGAGFALHEVWRLTSEVKEDWTKIRKRLSEIRARLVGIALQAKTLQLAPQVYSARFWSNFYRAMLTQTARSAITKFLVAVLAVLFVIHEVAAAQNQTVWVIAVDLTQSVAVRGPDGKSEFQKNIEAVTKLLAEVPADSRVTIIGITDHSFTQPDILLSAAIPPDAGYFGERLTTARKELVRTWKARSAKVAPICRQTDIIGALLLAEQVFSQQNHANRQLLTIFSDMRNSTPDLNLEQQGAAPKLSILSHKSQIADLRAVQVFVVGADGAGEPIARWLRLREFWRQYFLETGACPRDYSPLRD